ncbi:pleckstrin homology domain-containing family G member 1 [Engraulis encrasicolus]|uniref:pleckstrin homology domain-containing family G member 1 n=1 Tax=Engraulis encrasicolus TaxID=184585 RepID=UPI002FCF318C
MPTEEYSFSSDVLSPLPEIASGGGGAVLTSASLTGSPIRNSLIYSSPTHHHHHHHHHHPITMDSHSSHHADRPISYTSTSSSASSRDSHCSLGGGRSILGPAPHDHRDRDAGAIRLELVPARQLADEEEGSSGGGGKKGPGGTQTGRQDPDGEGHGDGERQGGAQTPDGDGGPKVSYVDRVVQEILDTERTYVHDLRSIAQDYLDCIINDTRMLLGVEERTSLFGNIQEIYRFNSALLHDLEKCHSDPVGIAECFVAKSEDFHIYTQYCTNYPRSVAVLTDCMRNKSIAKFLRERQESLKHSLPLGSYLLKPVQRILKYHLLLHEIANHLPKDTEMYEVVLEAIDTMQRVAWHINDMKRKHEHAVRLQEIQSLLTNWKGPDLVGYGELVLEGTFRIQRAKNERTLFLFDKLLLITKKREETYTYKAHILCCNLMLVEIIPKEPLSFSVFHYKNPKLQHTVQAKSQQDKRLWMLHLKRLILENHPAKIPAKAKQAILEMDAAHHPGFHFSPDGENKGSAHTKEGPSPRRGRRKSEPLSKLLKNSKQSVTSPDAQKRSSLGATLLTPVLTLGSIGRSRSLVSQSHESLDPCDHGDMSDREDAEGSHQQDADDEDESGMGSARKLRVPGKSSRKRLNAQASVDCIDALRDHNHPDLQTAKESLQMDPSEAPALRVSSPAESPSGVTMPNIWADHRVRRAMFPTRQATMQVDDDEDIYQMFMPPETGAEHESDRESTESTSGAGPGNADPPPAPAPPPPAPAPSRPCSWHEQRVAPPQRVVRLNVPGQTGNRGVLRRANSFGEQQSPETIPKGHSRMDAQDHHHHNSQGESSSNEISGSSSAEQLTIDDIENVYDNISLEELQAMGLVRRESEASVGGKSAPGPATSQVKSPAVAEHNAAADSKRSSTSTQEGTTATDTCELKIVEEEAIYDTITLIVPPLPARAPPKLKEETLSRPGHDSTILSSTTDLSINESFGMSVSASEESLLRIEDDDVASHVSASASVVSETTVLSPSVPPSEGSGKQEQQEQRRPSVASDRMSEQVDAIWNDLENYIRDNERKADKLPAAFPVSVSGHDAAAKCRSATSSPQRKPLSAKTNPKAGNVAGTPLTRSMSPPCTFKIPSLKIPELRREYSFEIDDTLTLSTAPAAVSATATATATAQTPSDPSAPLSSTPKSKPPAIKSCTSLPQPSKGSEVVPQPLPPKQKSARPTSQTHPLPPKPVQPPPKPALIQPAPTQTHQAPPTTTSTTAPAQSHPVPPATATVKTHHIAPGTTAPTQHHIPQTPPAQTQQHIPATTAQAHHVAPPPTTAQSQQVALTTTVQTQHMTPATTTAQTHKVHPTPATQTQTQPTAPMSTVQAQPLPPIPSPADTHPTAPYPPHPTPPSASPSPFQPLAPSSSIPAINVIPEVPEPPPPTTSVKSIRNRLARLSSGSFRMDDEDELVELSVAPAPSIQKELQNLFPGLEGTLFPPCTDLQLLAAEAGDQLLDLDKSKNRVFLMARQYSQKIKKANQLLKMKSMDVEPSCMRSSPSSSSRSKQKDLADILEEKKQGGAAIGARIAGYSQLYDEVMFKEAPGSLASPRRCHPGSRALSVPHGPRLVSSPSMPERATLEEAMLSCAYSNGELAEFFNWTRELPEPPSNQQPQSQSQSQQQLSNPQKKMGPAVSVPALKNLPPTPCSPPNQRWSTCVSTPSQDDPEHIYSTLGLGSAARSAKDPPYTRCQSSSSLADQREKENSGGVANLPRDHMGQSGQGQAGVPVSEATSNGRGPGPSLSGGVGPRRRSLPDSPPTSELTLRDSQQVLVLNRVQPLGTATATRNYLANFRDNGDDDDDDDYVEIRSEDESEAERERGQGQGQGQGRPPQTQSLPCSPSKSAHGHTATATAAVAERGRDHLKDYQWNEPEQHEQSLSNQPNLVHSLREKIHCLSSSSFA